VARQKLGQNFLAHEPTALRIVEAAALRPGDAVLEIGPGRGVLTRFLLESGARVTAVEIDARLADTLRRRWGHEETLSVARADFLEYPLPAWPEGTGTVVSNLPYSAANAILRRFLPWPGWAKAVVMVQKEVAGRMAAGPGGRQWGLLSLAVQGYASARALFDVPPGRFVPPPRVMSTVLLLTRRPRPLFSDENIFFRTARAAFGQRRKTVLNALSHGLERDKAAVAARLRSAGLDPSRRPETFSLDEFDRMSRALE
jgi:16S rRNA (adenine1518-N6/adenine1519-N6)-dimethyltransferase